MSLDLDGDENRTQVLSVPSFVPLKPSNGELSYALQITVYIEPRGEGLYDQDVVLDALETHLRNTYPFDLHDGREVAKFISANENLPNFSGDNSPTYLQILIREGEDHFAWNKEVLKRLGKLLQLDPKKLDVQLIGSGIDWDTVLSAPSDNSFDQISEILAKEPGAFLAGPMLPRHLIDPNQGMHILRALKQWQDGGDLSGLSYLVKERGGMAVLRGTVGAFLFYLMSYGGSFEVLEAEKAYAAAAIGMYTAAYQVLLYDLEVQATHTRGFNRRLQSENIFNAHFSKPLIWQSLFALVAIGVGNAFGLVDHGFANQLMYGAMGVIIATLSEDQAIVGEFKAFEVLENRIGPRWRKLLKNLEIGLVMATGAVGGAAAIQVFSGNLDGAIVLGTAATAGVFLSQTEKIGHLLDRFFGWVRKKNACEDTLLFGKRKVREAMAVGSE
jgi:hypothetical protein